MNWFNRIRARIGIDGIISAFLGLVAIGVAIYEFLGGSQVSQPVLVAVLSAFLLEIIFQRARLGEAEAQIINSLQGVHVETITNGRDFANLRRKLLSMTESHVYDTELCLPKRGSVPYVPGAENPYKELLNEKVLKRQLTVKFVQVVYERRHFEALLWKLFKFHKYDYYIGCFLGAPDVVPVMNVMIFDNRHFLVGGYYGPTVRGEDRNLYIQHKLIGATLRHYFSYLWSKARLLNDGGVIDWDAIQACGTYLGYTLEQLNSTIARIAQQVGFDGVEVLE